MTWMRSLRIFVRCSGMSLVSLRLALWLCALWAIVLYVFFVTVATLIMRRPFGKNSTKGGSFAV